MVVMIALVAVEYVGVFLPLASELNERMLYSLLSLNVVSHSLYWLLPCRIAALQADVPFDSIGIPADPAHYHLPARYLFHSILFYSIRFFLLSPSTFQST